jgi:hypothetical protein
MQFFVDVPSNAQLVPEGVKIQISSFGNPTLKEELNFWLVPNPDLLSDRDNDNVYDSTEIQLNLNPDNPDTDGDGVFDGIELYDPSQPEDYDHDGLLDALDSDNITYVDTDNDGLGNAYELYFGMDPLNSDSDGDGLNDGLECALLTADAIPLDSDSDGIVDALEEGLNAYPVDTDSDADGVLDSSDNCPTIPNPDQTDTDGDGIGDACDTLYEADLSVELSDSPDPVEVRSNLTITAEVTNHGPATSEEVELEITLPKGASVMSVNAPIGECDNDKWSVECSFDELQAGQSVTVDLRVKPQRAGSLRTMAEVYSEITSDPNLTNNTDTEITNVSRD